MHAHVHTHTIQTPHTAGYHISKTTLKAKNLGFLKTDPQLSIELRKYWINLVNLNISDVQKSLSWTRSRQRRPGSEDLHKREKAPPVILAQALRVRLPFVV